MLPDHRAFLDALLPALWKDLPAARQWPIDHLCYRVADEAGYQYWRQLLLAAGTLLAETPSAADPSPPSACTHR